MPTIKIRIGRNLPQWCLWSLLIATPAAMTWTKSDENSPNRKQFNHISTTYRTFSTISQMKSFRESHSQLLSTHTYLKARQQIVVFRVLNLLNQASNPKMPLCQIGKKDCSVPSIVEGPSATPKRKNTQIGCHLN